MKITKRLALTLAVSLGALLLIGGYGIWQLNQAQKRFDYIAVNTLPSLKALALATQAVSDIRVSALKAIVAPSDSLRSGARETLANADKHFDAALADYLANDISNDADRQMLEADKTAMANYQRMLDQAFQMAAQGDKDGALKYLMVTGLPMAQAIVKCLEDHAEFNYDLASDLVKKNQSDYTQALEWSMLLIAIAFVVAGFMGVQLFRLISAGLNGIQDTLEQVSQTLDFTCRARVDRQDEIGLTATAFNKLLATQQESLKSILHGARDVGTTAEQLNQAAGEVSTASHAQSEAAATMAATVEQMTVSVNHIAERAKQTHALSKESERLVQDGSSIIGQTIKDIHQISSSVSSASASIRELETYSGQVSSVIGVIGDIADQTNLLALNAAIEAARAGESGRGFAVVADEVRKLAERTTRSTQEISTTIQTMVERAAHATRQMHEAEQLVETGVKRADEADAAIQKIGATSTQSGVMIGEITTAIGEQGVASNSIAVEVERTAQMSEESSAAAQHTANTAQHLDGLAKGQIATLSKYNL
ncbi:methyl-accepting chemotaxis protein [Paludibacterium purpuratum]|uniref:Methyl-accepting chemotaxis protein n=1 Tax=Paludibacterium purpuratum TaxID=1144873 RepID=A0A4R7B5N3_9NEIS|nr:methyl-accepting chemotaxis protein [Paludibacterium purpuratum]TDR79713.1 methyl-accepting chemotaxis protein [Paludibacterium purpuratum]